MLFASGRWKRVYWESQDKVVRSIGVLIAVVIISMHVLTANATYLDDSTANLNVPSDIIKVLLKPHLSLENDGQVIVLIDLQPDDLNSIAVSHNLNLRPVIKAIVE